MRLLLAAGEMHDADHLVRRIRLDKEPTVGVERRRGVARHPIAIGREKVHRQVLGEDHVIERRLLDEKELRPLQHPRGEVVLGFAGPAVPYWTLTGDRPSVTLVDTPVGLHAMRDPEGFRVRFPWRGSRLDLPLADRHLCAALDDMGRARIGAGDLQRLLGFRPRRVLAVLTPPFRGYCYKVAAALLPTR